MKCLSIDFYNAGTLSPVILNEEENDEKGLVVEKRVRLADMYALECKRNGLCTCPVVFLHSLTEDEFEQWKRLTDKMIAIHFSEV